MSASDNSEPESEHQRRGPPSPALSTIEEVSEPPSRRVSDAYVDNSSQSSPEPLSEIGDANDTKSRIDRDTSPSPTSGSGTFRLSSAPPSPQGGYLYSQPLPSIPEIYNFQARPRRVIKRGHRHNNNGPCILATCPYFWKRKGRLGKYQGNASLVAGREVPGRRTRWSANTPANGDIWIYPYEMYLGGRIQNAARRTWAREVIDNVDASLQLEEDDVQDVFKVMNHPNLVNAIDWDGFGEDGSGGNQDNVRREVAWERCDAGTLNRLLVDYGKPLPESFIWHTLISMLRALQHFSYGQSDVFDTKDGGTVSDLIVEGWQPILHNQINPANIFYCKPNPTTGYERTCYGACKLGNFSNALVLRGPLWFWDREAGQAVLGHDSISVLDLDRQNITRERHQYYDYDAPELSIHMDRALDIDTRESHFDRHGHRGGTVGNASDIWSLGAVIVVMMTGGKRNNWEVLSTAYDEEYLGNHEHINRVKVVARLIDEIDAVDEDDEHIFDPIKEFLPDEYSNELRQLVSWMMDPRPQLRLEIHELLEQGLLCYRQVRRRERAAGRESDGEWTLAETLDGDVDKDEEAVGDLDSGVV